jgi:hypothetical protein
MYNSDMPNRADLPSKRKLIRSTLIAAASAAVLLVTVILPAEYGVDPTRIGGVLGLTEMGQIKQQLAEEASQETSLEADQETSQETGQEAAVTPPEYQFSEPIAPIEEETSAIIWGDEATLTLKPGEAAEVKLTMKKGEKAEYEWVTDQGHLNSDLHADGANKDFTSYRKGRAETSDTGTFEAEFDGVHGWYWRNRSDETVSVTLRVRGQYSAIKRVL